MIDDAGCHEQGSFESRMVHDVEDRGDLTERRVQTSQKRNQSEMADG
jgi:hypothetical protein